MSEEDRNSLSEKLGKKLRFIRKSRNISLKTMSDETGMSYSYLSGLENGKYSVSIANLQRISAYFGVNMVYFLEQENNETHFFRRSERGRFPDEEGICYEVLTSSETADIQVSHVMMPPHAPSKSLPHAHSRGHELIVALKGSCMVLVEGESYRLTAGDSLIFASNRQHVIFTKESAAEFMIIASPPYGKDFIR